MWAVIAATQPVPVQPLVLVGEDVRAVAAQPLGEIDVGLSLPEQTERLRDRRRARREQMCSVIASSSGAFRSLAHPSLEARR